jgi:MFS family permease
VNYVMAATKKQTDTKTVQPTAHRRFQAQRGRLPCTYATVRQLYCAIHACAHPQKHHVWISTSLTALLRFGLPEQAARILEPVVDDGAVPRGESPFGLVRQNSRITRLAIAVLVSSAGDPFSQTVSLVLLYQATRAPLAIAGAFGAEMLGVLTVGALIGPAADRINRRALIIRMEALRFLIVASLPVVTTVSVFLLYPFLFLLASVEALVQPSRQAAVPEFVSPRGVGAANSLLMTAVTVGQATGFAAAGVALAHVSNPRLLYVADAVTFAIACLLVTTLRGMGGGIVRTKLRGGVQRAWTVPGVPPLLLVAMTTALFVGMLNPSLLPAAYALSSNGPTAFAALQVCLIAGGVVGSVAAGRIGRERQLTALAVALWIFATGVFAVALSPSLWLAGLAVAISGLGNAVYLVTNTSALMEASANTNRGTVMSARFTVTQATTALGLVIGGAMIGWLGPLRAFGGFGLGLLLVAGLFTALLVVRARARNDASGPHHPSLPENLDRDKTG